MVKRIADVGMDNNVSETLVVSRSTELPSQMLQLEHDWAVCVGDLLNTDAVDVNMEHDLSHFGNIDRLVRAGHVLKNDGY